MRILSRAKEAVVDLGVVLMIGIAFVGMTVVGFIVWQVRASLVGSLSGWTSARANHTLHNITQGFDNAIGLILVAITIFILALAISALLLLRQR